MLKTDVDCPVRLTDEEIREFIPLEKEWRKMTKLVESWREEDLNHVGSDGWCRNEDYICVETLLNMFILMRGELN